jgi:hypothetical protein
VDARDLVLGSGDLGSHVGHVLSQLLTERPIGVDTLTQLVAQRLRLRQTGHGKLFPFPTDLARTVRQSVPGDDPFRNRFDDEGLPLLALGVEVLRDVMNWHPVRQDSARCADILPTNGKKPALTSESPGFRNDLPFAGGRYWDRTSDPCRVKAVLSR